MNTVREALEEVLFLLRADEAGSTEKRPRLRANTVCFRTEDSIDASKDSQGNSRLETPSRHFVAMWWLRFCYERNNVSEVFFARRTLIVSSAKPLASCRRRVMASAAR